MNDSFIDFDLLGVFDPYKGEVTGPSIYSDMLWECRKLRAESQLPPMDWIVMRNRFNPNADRTALSVSEQLKKLSQRIGFRIAAGFAERMIYRELFSAGLTVLDVQPPKTDPGLRSEYAEARREIGALVDELRLPGFESAAVG